MTDNVSVSGVTFGRATQADVSAGLLGFVAATVDGLRIDGIALRRTRSGSLDLRYPERRRPGSREGRAVVRPLTESVRQAIERQVFDALFAQGVLP